MKKQIRNRGIFILEKSKEKEEDISHISKEKMRIKIKTKVTISKVFIKMI